jgi:hypothetical protein
VTRIRCFVGRTGPELGGTAPFLTNAPLNGLTIAQHFRNGSVTSEGSPAIELTLDLTRLDAAHVAGEDVGAGELNEALETLRGTDGPAPEGITIGLILANRYRGPEGTFGVMFDADPAVLGSGTQSSALVQRQGCAVFLEALGAKHGGDGAALREHALFTAIHELGHVFNLWHAGDPASFMTPSSGLTFPAPHPDDVYRFADPHHDFLERCDFDEHVQPGGSDFGLRGPGAPSVIEPFDEPVTLPRLALRVDVQPRRFWQFEPVELDLSLAVTSGRRLVKLPREVDPSHERFTIWITEPSGERRRYRPAIRCCANEDTIEIGPRAPYQRDVSLFRESGGYTFRGPGVHRVEATLDLHGRRVRSNAVEVEVLPEPLKDRAAQAIRRVLTAPAGIALLQHRSRKVDEASIAVFRSLARRYPKTLAAAGLQYTLGRTLLRRALEPTRPERRAAELTQALELLRRARDHRSLSPHRRRLADRLIDEHGPASRVRPCRRGRRQQTRARARTTAQSTPKARR